MLSIQQIKTALGKAYDTFVTYLQANNLPTTPLMGPNQLAIKAAILKYQYKHVTLDPNVPPDLGCAEAWSFIAAQAKIPGIPPSGFAGTGAAYQFMNSSRVLVLVDDPLPYDTVVWPTGTSSKGSDHGHMGYVGEDGIVYSNDSNSGLFVPNYTLASAHQFFGVTEGFPTYYFRWV